MSGQAFANDATASPAQASSEPRPDLNPETPSINATTWSDPPIDPLLFADEVEVDVDVAQHAVEDAESASDDAESYVSDLDMFPDDDEEDIVAPAPAPAPAPASASTLAEAQALIFAAATATATATETVADDAADSDDADMTIYAASDRPSVDATEDSTTDADSLMTGTDNQSILTIDGSVCNKLVLCNKLPYVPIFLQPPDTHTHTP